MSKRRPTLQITGWFVSLMLLCAALLPMPMPADTQSGNWVELCTAHGMKKVALPSDLIPKPAPQSSADCSWCSIHCGNLASLLSPSCSYGLGLFVAQRAPLGQVHSYLNPAAAYWPSARPRAPPALAG